MIDRRIVVFRSRLRPGVEAEYGARAEQIATLAVRMPGFVSATDFVSEDGERLALIEWDSPERLAAWREHPEHVLAQRAGRERFYARYSLQICGELRSSRFDAATGDHVQRDRDPARLRAIAERWLDCFARRDLDGLLALYADHAEHTSPKIRARHPETGGMLRGKPALRAWWADAFERLPSMRYEPTAITADARRVVMEYVRHVDGEPDLPVAEVLEVEGGAIVRSKVFHG
ncbi:MAG TPA: nuclear transport factor 2 family protein [Kofleriaceae bacterium]|nr:nuclear transport factor 2 family protein [Kofleriaceae bacterium]